MPFELPLDDPPLDDWVLVEEDEPDPVDELEEEFDPQAVTASAAKTSSNAAQRRGDLSVMERIIALL